MKESPLFSKTYDFLCWLLPLTIKFPRQQRFVLAAALQKEALHFQGLLIEAAHQPSASERLCLANAELAKVRSHLRLSRDLALISPGQYEHGARLLVEIGRLVGGWIKKVSGGEIEMVKVCRAAQ